MTTPWEDDVTPNAPGCDAPVAITPARFSDRQERFIQYRAGHEPARAAIMAGIAPSRARAQAWAWERNDAILSAISAARDHVAEEVQWNPKDILAEYAIIAFSTIDDYEIDAEGNLRLADEAPANAMRAVQSFKRTITQHDNGDVTYTGELRLYDKQHALGKMGEWFGMWLKRIRFEEDGEVKATLAAMRKTMERVEARHATHAIEDARVAEFRQTVNAAGQLVAGSTHPIAALRAMADHVSHSHGESND
jgi:phage terminase small subunit